MSTRLRLVVMAAAIFVLAAAALAADANDRFKGGSYDGWYRDAMSEYAALIFQGTIISFR